MRSRDQALLVTGLYEYIDVAADVTALCDARTEHDDAFNGGIRGDVIEKPTYLALLQGMYPVAVLEGSIDAYAPPRFLRYRVAGALRTCASF